MLIYRFALRGFSMKLDFRLKSPLLIGVVYSPRGLFINTDYAGETTPARFSIIQPLTVK